MPNIANISINSAEALLPTAYSVQEITFVNHAGREFDIKALVTDFSIAESIYRPALQISLNVKDPVNTLEEFQMTGQEEIRVTVARKPYGSKDEVSISLPFVVTEYPVFGRFDTRLQVYTVRAVAPHAFVSELKKISRAFSGTIQEFVRQVLRNDLGVDEKDMEISDASTAIINFVVPNMAPLDAIHWALRRAYDSSGSPFYFYQRLDGKIVLETQAEMVAKEEYKEYVDAKFWQYDQTGDSSIRKDYEERSKRILTMVSDVRMSKFTSIPNGAYSSRSEYLDLSKKTVERSDFRYGPEFSSMKWIDKNKVLSSTFVPGKEQDALSDFTDSLINYVPVNSLAFGNGINYHEPTKNSALNRAQSYLENMDTIVHDITLAGDFQLNAGKIALLKLPPALDPEAKVKNSEASNDVKRDSYFSGKYVVASIVHNFSEKYTVDVKVKRDTLAFKLTAT